MKLLLTSGGVTNPSIESALVDLLGRPIADCSALCIPTAQWGHPMCGPASVHRFIGGDPQSPMTGLGWRSLGVLELSALADIDEQRWHAWVRDTDVLLVDGGDATFLCHWMTTIGLPELLSSLPSLVWVGMSAGSMVMTPRVGSDFVAWAGAPDDRTLGLVDFSIFPHLDHEQMPRNTLSEAERWVRDVGVPAYAIDDQTAITVVDGHVEIVSEGRWHQLTPAARGSAGPAASDG